ncbi:MAG: UDP-N-acetylmuramoyl-L-alanine--D-glutamate ligase [Methyloceanibacter sp.]|uniref:UDP-N-acetylmuramoyl-L-alanine--D-glutamate ligase n=1 Tax=Methyloceanibacter sp. TaxID=1965321 RepID=UPI003D9AE643
MIPVTSFAGRDVAVFGLGVSGIAAARALQAGGAKVHAWDDGASSREAASAQGILLSDLSTADWSAFATLVLAPGVPLTHPAAHWSVAKAQAANVEIIGDTELFFRERAAQGSAAKIVAITGTNGKSTTSALTAHILAAGGKRVSLGGNIGNAVLDLEPFADDLIYVIEFSTFQIDLTPTLAPDAAALLNIAPDHLDRHGSIENYAAIKARIFAGLPRGGTAVIGVDDPLSRAIADRLSGSAVRRVAVGEPVKSGVWVKDGMLIEVTTGIELADVNLAGIGALRGEHNWQNAAIAYALARSQGLDAAAIERGLQSFAGLAHRMEQVGRVGSVLFVNDSKATNADAASKALASFTDIFWIVGGRPKSGGLADLEPLFFKVKRAYLIGEAADAFADELKGRVDSTICGTLAKAVSEAAADASRSKAREPVVLLSPACASYDQFANFEARGKAFRDIVLGLEGVEDMNKEQGKAA